MSQTLDHLRSRVPSAQLERGVRALRSLSEGSRKLLAGRGLRVLGQGDGGYASWHGYDHSPALEAIATQGWVERHLADFAGLAQAPGLDDCCRTTVCELFGEPAFHVAIQFFPESDGLVRNLCHASLPRVEHVKRVARQLTNYRHAPCGGYRPPGWGHALVSTDSPLF